MIRWLLRNFGDTDSGEHFVGFGGLHVLVMVYQLFILEFAILSTLLFVYAVIMYFFGVGWHTMPVFVVMLNLLATMFCGIHAVRKLNVKMMRLFSVRTKMFYTIMGVWGLLDVFFLESDFLDKVLGAVKVAIAIVYIVEDKALMRAIDYARYRYNGISLS